MEYPNKIFVFEHTGENGFGSITHFVIVVAASSIEVGREHIKRILGCDVELTWLMNAVYPTIYTRDGGEPKLVQAKILYNGHKTFTE